MSNAANPVSSDSLLTPCRSFFSHSFSKHWKLDIQRSGLPEEVQNLIETVVVKSRLLRFEKAEIATELISHFQDGETHGRSHEQLMNDFGDPAIIASLFRSAKMRNRPMFMKTFKGLVIGLGVMTAAYLSVLAIFHLGQPNPRIDYLVKLNGEIAEIDDSQKAWLLYRPVWTKYGLSEGGDCQFDDLFANDESGTGQRLAKPTDASWPQAVAQLKEYRELLDVFRVGAKLPSLGLQLQADRNNYSDEDFAALFPGQDKTSKPMGWVVDEKAEELLRDSLLNISLPHIQSFRKVARALHVDTRLAVERGDSDRAVENIETVFGMANQAAEPHYLVCGLVGMAVAGIGFEQLEEVITADPDFFTEPQLAQLQAAIERMPIRSWIDFEGERAMIKDVIQRCYTDNGKGDGRMTASGVDLLASASVWMLANSPRVEDDVDGVAYAARKFMAPAALFMCASRKEVNEKTDELIDRCMVDAQLPYWQWSDPEGFQRETDAFLEENRIRHALLAMMLPAHTQILNALNRTIGRQEGVIAALAIHRYYKTMGHWPSEVAQVSPEYVNEFPQDQVDGSLLKFKCIDDQLMVYSVGRDYDDDGGVDHGWMTHGRRVPHGRAQFTFGPRSNEFEGDWILWPQNVSPTDETAEK